MGSLHGGVSCLVAERAALAKAQQQQRRDDPLLPVALRATFLSALRPSAQAEVECQPLGPHTSAALGENDDDDDDRSAAPPDAAATGGVYSCRLLGGPHHAVAVDALVRLAPSSHLRR
mmetsp:Transcript_3297/g.12668  ORF Transcript_3297/g.12668 Transcript_3297/m.12668 type:complete len:118 (+) Transcript_3297:214-567(+)